jgi:hypothetical protein
VLSPALTTAVGAVPAKYTAAPTQTTSINNGGDTANCGASCDQSHNPTDYEKPCDPLPGNGCHQLPDPPCERGHGGTEIGNKHCGPGLTILKEQGLNPNVPRDFTHDLLVAPLSVDVYYRVTVTNPTSTDYTVVERSALRRPVRAHARPERAAVAARRPECRLHLRHRRDPGAGGIPRGRRAGPGPYTLTNTVTALATPVGGGSAATLTDTVTASLN